MTRPAAESTHSTAASSASSHPIRGCDTPCPSSAPGPADGTRRFDAGPRESLLNWNAAKPGRARHIRRVRRGEQLRVAEECPEEDARIEDSVAAAEHRLASAENVEGEAEARTEVVVILVQERARLSVDARKYRRAQEVRSGNAAARIEVDLAVVALVRLLLVVLAQARD